MPQPAQGFINIIKYLLGRSFNPSYFLSRFLDSSSNSCYYFLPNVVDRKGKYRATLRHARHGEAGGGGWRLRFKQRGRARSVTRVESAPCSVGCKDRGNATANRSRTRIDVDKRASS